MVILPTFGYFRKQGENVIAARKNLWDGNNEPFITQNEIARKNKHPKKVHFIKALRCPRLVGYKVLSVQLPGPRATVSHAPCAASLLSAGSAAFTTWRESFSVSKCVLVAVSHFDKDVESCCNT